MIRAFVAIEIPTSLRESLERTMRRLQRLDLDARFSRPESLHLTLKFLGDIREDQVDAIGIALAEAARVRDPFPISVAGLGAFPQLADPRVVWVGIDGGSPLEELQRAVETGLSDLGFAADTRSFQPHLTLARVKSRHNIAALIHHLESERLGEPLGDFVAREVHLYRSVLRPDGARYTKLVSQQLINGG